MIPPSVLHRVLLKPNVLPSASISFSEDYIHRVFAAGERISAPGFFPQQTHRTVFQPSQLERLMSATVSSPKAATLMRRS